MEKINVMQNKIIVFQTNISIIESARKITEKIILIIEPIGKMFFFII